MARANADNRTSRLFPSLACAAAVFLSSLAVLTGCSRQPAPPSTAPAPPSQADSRERAWTEFAARFIEDYFKAQPFFAVQAGRHEFDGQMPDLSASGIANEVARLKAVRAEANAFDEAALAPPQRLEREYLLSVIDNNLFWLDRARAPFTNPAWYVDRLDPEVYLSRDYAPLAVRMKGYIGYARSIPKIAADIRSNLKTPLPATFVDRGIDAFGGFAEFFRQDVPKVFASVQDAAAKKDLAAANSAAAQAMQDLASWLKSERQHSTVRAPNKGHTGQARTEQGGPATSDGFALGESLFAEMLKATEQVDLPIQQLAEIGRADLDRNTQALKDACAVYLPKGTLRACIDKMSAHKPQGGPVEAARAQLAELKAFIVARQVVTIPGQEEALVAEAPPYNRANFAYINIPGPYEKGVPSVYNIAPPDPSWPPRKRAEYIPGQADLLYTSVHEVWPGHFLQFLHANRDPSKIAALWVGYAYAEGWAHYCEEMMWEEGLGNGDPEQHIGQLANALLRNVRFLSAIGLHTQGMTVAQSEQMFRERAFSDPGNAQQQAARGTYDPAYLNYTLGKLMIRKLRSDWIAKQPGAAGQDPKQFWHAFHDQFLAYGGPPIPLARKAMLGEVGSIL